MGDWDSEISRDRDFPLGNHNQSCPLSLSPYSQEVVRATAVAMDYWIKFQKDVVVDLVCFRRW